MAQGYCVKCKGKKEIANAQEVKIRLRGVSGNIERTMSKASRKRVKAFLVKYYGPEAADPTWPLRSLDQRPSGWDAKPISSPKASAT